MTKVDWGGNVIGGRLELDDREAFNRYWKQFEGKRIKISIDKETRRRSNPQNKYLWACVYKTISDFTGYNIDEVHEICKAKFNLRHASIVDKETGEVTDIEYGGRTATLTTEQFMEYVQKIQIFFAELGCNIPDPGQTEWIDDTKET